MILSFPDEFLCVSHMDMQACWLSNLSILSQWFSDINPALRPWLRSWMIIWTSRQSKIHHTPTDNVALLLSGSKYKTFCIWCVGANGIYPECRNVSRIGEHLSWSVCTEIQTRGMKKQMRDNETARWSKHLIPSSVLLLQPSPVLLFSAVTEDKERRSSVPYMDSVNLSTTLLILNPPLSLSVSYSANLLPGYTTTGAVVPSQPDAFNSSCTVPEFNGRQLWGVSECRSMRSHWDGSWENMGQADWSSSSLQLESEWFIVKRRFRLAQCFPKWIRVNETSLHSRMNKIMQEVL